MLPTIFFNFNDKQVRFFKITAELIPAEKDGGMTCRNDRSSPIANGAKLNEKDEEMTQRNVRSSPIANGAELNEKDGEMTVHNGRSSPEEKPRFKFKISNLPARIARHTRERIGMPLPDYAEAIGYSWESVYRIMQRNPKSFYGYWITLPIPDSLGRMQNTIILFEEAIVGLTMKLQETRLKNPAIETSIVCFKRQVMELIPAIRRGDIMPVRVVKKIEGILPDYQEALQYRGYARSDRMKELQGKDGVTLATVYRRCKVLNNGQNLQTKEENAKKSPSNKGLHKRPLEFQKVIITYLADSCLPNKEIWKKSGTNYSYGHVNLILREYKREALKA